MTFAALTEKVPALGRHQALALLTTGLDLTVMLAMVEVVGLRPSLGALVGASVGAVFNFLMSRRFVFPQGRGGAATGQALRYAMVAAASAGLNAGGVEAGERLGVPYEIGRLVTSLVVSLAWNYPMQRRFVFGARRASEGRRGGVRRWRLLARS